MAQTPHLLSLIYLNICVGLIQNSEPVQTDKESNEELQVTSLHLKILLYIIENGESYYNELKLRAKNELGMSNTTVVTAIKRLKAAEMIQLVREENNEIARGRAKKIYGTTLLGLINAMRSHRHLWYNLDKIADSNTTLLPLIFGKRSLYLEKSMYTNNSNFLNYCHEMGEQYEKYGLPLENNLWSIISLNLHRIFNTSSVINIRDEHVLKQIVTYKALMFFDKPGLNLDSGLESFNLYLTNIEFNEVKQLWGRMFLGENPREVLLMTLAARDADLKEYFTNNIGALKTYYTQMNQNISQTEKLWQGIIRLTR